MSESGNRRSRPLGARLCTFGWASLPAGPGAASIRAGQRLAGRVRPPAQAPPHHSRPLLAGRPPIIIAIRVPRSAGRPAAVRTGQAPLPPPRNRGRANFRSSPIRLRRLPLVVIVALYCGDPIATGEHWASRATSLLAMPIPGPRFCAKVRCPSRSSFVGQPDPACLAFLVGGVFFGLAPGGFAPVVGTFETSTTLQRLAIVVA